MADKSNIGMYISPPRDTRACAHTSHRRGGRKLTARGSRLCSASEPQQRGCFILFFTTDMLIKTRGTAQNLKEECKHLLVGVLKSVSNTLLSWHTKCFNLIYAHAELWATE